MLSTLNNKSVDHHIMEIESKSSRYVVGPDNLAPPSLMLMLPCLLYSMLVVASSSSPFRYFSSSVTVCMFLKVFVRHEWKLFIYLWQSDIFREDSTDDRLVKRGLQDQPTLCRKTITQSMVLLLLLINISFGWTMESMSSWRSSLVWQWRHIWQSPNNYYSLCVIKKLAVAIGWIIKRRLSSFSSTPWHCPPPSFAIRGL